MTVLYCCSIFGLAWLADSKGDRGFSIARASWLRPSEEHMSPEICLGLVTVSRIGRDHHLHVTKLQTAKHGKSGGHVVIYVKNIPTLKIAPHDSALTSN